MPLLHKSVTHEGMDKVAKQTNLTRRGAVYYFRTRVPFDIVDSVGKAEVCYSLKTKDHAEAVRKVRHELSKIEDLFQEHRSALAYETLPAQEEINTDQLKHIHDAYYQHLLEEDEETRLSGFYKGAMRALPSDTFEEFIETSEILAEVTASDYAQGDVETFFLGEAEEVLSWNGVEIKLQADSIAMRKVARTLQEAAIAAYGDIEKRNKGVVIKTPEQLPQTSSKALSGECGLLLSAVLEEWIADKSSGESWTKKTTEAHKRAIGLFMDLCGDRPIGDYTKADARAFKKALLTLPPRWKQLKQLKGLTIAAAADKALELRLPPVKPKTARKDMLFVSSFWSWLLSNYDVDTNIFAGLKITVKGNAKDARNPFTEEELQSIFSSPLYRGCLSKKKWMDAGNLSMKNTALYWAPLIALYSGMRLNEILQLHLTDIKQEGGIHYYDLTEGAGKRFKTASSQRRIPIHHKIIEAGFLEFIAMRKAKRSSKDQLFLEVKPDTYGSYGKATSDSFTELLKHLGIKHEKNSFHSFRHTFQDGCRNSGVPLEVMKALQGHSDAGVSSDYGSGFSLEVLNKELQKVSYGGLTFN